MPVSDDNVAITLRPGLYIYLALALLIVPVKWVLAWLLAAAFHELCHYICLRLCRCKVFSIQFGCNGAVMDSKIDSWGKEILCALSGPTGGCLLLLVAGHLPRTALCALFQSVYNLLPIYPLDGGRALHALLRKYLTEENATKIIRAVETAVLCIFAAVSAYMSAFLRLGAIPLILAAILIMKSRKNTLKRNAVMVQ